MSIFDWFTSTKPAKTKLALGSSGAGHVDATHPLMHSDQHGAKLVQQLHGPTANRKIERLEHREFIYSVVRDSMIRAGVLAASYKFKVLSLDAHGLQYLIMMDLADQSVSDSIRLSEIEAMIAQAAKMRHNMTVTAVYWRVSEQVTAGLPQKQPVREPSKVSVLPVPRPSATPVAATTRQGPGGYEPLQEDEVTAFKRALASVTPAAARWASGHVVTSGRRNPTPPADFEDTQRVDSNEKVSPLSVTQYGDLT
jgi:hypothetical protein